MTGRAVFGDFAGAARRHLSARPQARQPGYRNPAAVAAEVHEYGRGLHRALTVMRRYVADFAALPEEPGSDEQPGSWQRASAAALTALDNACGYVQPPPVLTTTLRPPRLTSTASRDLDAATKAIAAGRDLLHTHFAADPRGTRQQRSEWAPVLTSPAMAKALLTEVSGWIRQILAQADHLTSAQARRSVRSDEHRKLITACRWLATLVSSVEQAQHDDPVPADDLTQLHAIPVNMLRPRRRPRGAETTAALSHGIADCAERVRRAAATAVREAAWSPCLTAESFSQTAESATAIAHHCEILLRALADRAAKQEDIQLGEKLLASAEAAASARVGWLETARAWYGIRTDARGGMSPVATEAADLVQWTGRLAYANPGWAPQLAPAEATGPSPPLATGDARDFGEVANAVHNASLTLTAIAASDYAQIRTAARKGRLIVPVPQADCSGHPARLFDRAPLHRGEALLRVYRQAGAASATATGQISRIAAQISPECYGLGLPHAARRGRWR